MTAPSALSAVDDPDELAELTRTLPAEHGVRRLEAVLRIDGVHCAACVLTIERAVRERVEMISINALTGRSHLIFRPDEHRFSEILARIQALGYEPRPVNRQVLALSQDAHRRRTLWQMLVAVFCMMQIMMYAWPRYVAGPGEMAQDLRQVLVWAEWTLSLPVLLLASGSFLKRAWRDLRSRHLGMDVPVALGILVTFVASSVGLSTHSEVWFDSLAMFVAFLLVGRWLEARAREQAIAGMTDLMAALPEVVDRRNHDGTFSSVHQRHLKIGDLIRVATGQAIPADGILVTEHAEVDESLLTGESTPCHRKAGEAMTAGSFNLSGPLLLTVTRHPRDSRLAHIADLVHQLAASKPRVAQLADRWAQSFTLVILLLAALSTLVWLAIDPARAFWVAASVLIVTCPCALSLATPAAMLAASATLARSGLLVRTPQAIEALAQADLMVLDKTGTLTTHRAQQVHVDLFKNPWALDQEALEAIVVALTAGSMHPVARALHKALPTPAHEPALDAIQEWRGQGITARTKLADRWVEARLGHADFVLPPTEAFPESPETGRAAGVWLGLDGHCCARLILEEALRPDAALALSCLRQTGLELAIVSGDHAQAVQRVARVLQISMATAQASPEDKLALVQTWQQAGRRVVMVGDGINDAPVLAQADVSVTFAQSAALAQYHADLLILNERLSSLSRARDQARRAMRVVRQNLVFAAAYNLIGVPLAVLGAMPPWLAGLGMAGSSLMVVLNALRLAPSLPSKHPLYSSQKT